MTRKGAFLIGFTSALTLSGVVFYFLLSEVKEVHESIFMAGYINEVSTLSALLNEEDESVSKSIVLAEMCEAISILHGKFESGNYKVSYVEVVASVSASSYQEKLQVLNGKYCAKNT